MKQTIHRLLLTLCLMAFLTSPSWGWSGGGHQVVALIAWSRLTPEERVKVIEILKEHPRFKKDFSEDMPAFIVAGSDTDRQRWLFAQAALWPDLARDLRDFHQPTWHFINFPVFLNDQDKAALTGHLAVNLDLDWMPTIDDDIQNAAQTVDRAIKTLKDPEAKAGEKALMLSWLFHVVGDLHQPLHCVALFTPRIFRQGDRGGNSIELHPNGAQADGISLHAFWDHLHKTTISVNEASTVMQSILGEPGIPAKAEAAKDDLQVKNWIEEGRQAALQFGYTPLVLDAVRKAEADPNFNHKKVFVICNQDDVTDYGKKAGPVASERAAIGGFRLAEILKKALK